MGEKQMEKYNFYSRKTNLGVSNLIWSQCTIPSPNIEAAHKKGSGSTKNGRDSLSKRRGVKVFGDQTVVSGGIILRQVGSKFHAGICPLCRNDAFLCSVAEQA